MIACRSCHTHCVQVVTHYLVKWKSLPYEDSTWELQVCEVDTTRVELNINVFPVLQEDVDHEKIRIFNQINTLPSEIMVSVLLVAHTC